MLVLKNLNYALKETILGLALWAFKDTDLNGTNISEL